MLDSPIDEVCNENVDRAQLEAVLDLILNSADFKDLEVLRAAVQRRTEDLNKVGRVDLDLNRLSKKMANDIQSQIGGTREQIQKMAREMVTKMIRQQVPDIPEEHLATLLAEWVPTETEKAQKPVRKEPKSPIPADVLLTMVKDFVTYSAGAMSASKQVQLNDEIPDWQNLYWQRFPQRVQKLIRLLLEDKIPPEVFWEEVRRTVET